MHFALLIVGAHKGERTRDLILGSAARGPVLLIEPVPHLFAALAQSYAGVANVTCLQSCVALEAGTVRFHAPTETAQTAFPWGDQLGSLRAEHAVRHEPALAAHVVDIPVRAVTFRDLVERYDITSLDMLFTDTESYDTILLPGFPFERMRPRQITFEYKHGDGTFNIGRKLGRLLIMLDDLGYDIRVTDFENCLATLRT
jgi:FkbM family methyltransferase